MPRLCRKCSPRHSSLGPYSLWLSHRPRSPGKTPAMWTQWQLLQLPRYSTRMEAGLTWACFPSQVSGTPQSLVPLTQELWNPRPPPSGQWWCGRQWWSRSPGGIELNHCIYRFFFFFTNTSKSTLTKNFQCWSRSPGGIELNHCIYLFFTNTSKLTLTKNFYVCRQCMSFWISLCIRLQCKNLEYETCRIIWSSSACFWMGQNVWKEEIKYACLRNNKDIAWSWSRKLVRDKDITDMKATGLFPTYNHMYLTKV